MSTPPVFILGGAQTDFAYNWSRHEKSLFDIFESSVKSGLEAARVNADEIEVAHLASFSSEAFCRQNQLGGWLPAIDRKLSGVASSRHEAACAAGSVAILAASAEIQAGRYDVALVSGVEQMRHVPGKEAADVIGMCAWQGREAQDADFVWPHLFSNLVDHYREHHELKRSHLEAISKKNYEQARDNPNAQTRGWKLGPHAFEEHDGDNPHVEGNLRRYDCSQITDGGATAVVASERFAEAWAKREGKSLDEIPRLLGFGHRTATMRLEDKLAQTEGPITFPELQRTVQDALRRSGLKSAWDLDIVETHDCFNISEYVALDHFGLAEPGHAYELLEQGVTLRNGKLPFNPGGGLMGGGHPIGATGIRMALDAVKQVRQEAGDMQVDGAKTVGTMNIGGSFTTTVSLVIGL